MKNPNYVGIYTILKKSGGERGIRTLGNLICQSIDIQLSKRGLILIFLAPNRLFDLPRSFFCTTFMGHGTFNHTSITPKRQGQFEWALSYGSSSFCWQKTG
jgi:hypothetical protein